MWYYGHNVSKLINRDNWSFAYLQTAAYPLRLSQEYLANR